MLNAPPISLDFDRGEIPIPPDLDNALGRAMLKIMGFESKRSKLLHGEACRMCNAPGGPRGEGGRRRGALGCRARVHDARVRGGVH